MTEKRGEIIMRYKVAGCALLLSVILLSGACGNGQKQDSLHGTECTVETEYTENTETEVLVIGEEEAEKTEEEEEETEPVFKEYPYYLGTENEKDLSEIFEVEMEQASLKKVADGYELTLYDKDNEKVYSEIYPVPEGSIKLPVINEISEDLLEISMSVGSPATYIYFFNKETAEISPTYFNPIVVENKYIAYMDYDKGGVFVFADIFQRGEVYIELERNFTYCVDGIGAIIDIELLDNKNIKLEYYEGEDFTKKTEVIPLNRNETGSQTISEEELRTWVGEYTFLELATTPAGVPMMMEFVIQIYENGYADISIDGQTTCVSIRAEVHGNRKEISLVFAEYLPADVTSGDYWDYSDVLVSFRRVGDDIYTYWGELKPFVLLYDDQISGKIYFTRKVSKK